MWEFAGSPGSGRCGAAAGAHRSPGVFPAVRLSVTRLDWCFGAVGHNAGDTSSMLRVGKAPLLWIV